MVRHLLISVLLVSPAVYGADKTADQVREVLREVGGLQDQIKALDKSLDARLAALGQSGAQQAREAADQTGKAVAALSDRLQKGVQNQQDQADKTTAAVAAATSQLQSLSGEMATLRNAVNELAASMNRLATQVGDLTTAVKELQPKTAPPEISASDLFAGAESDRLGGKLTLALQEYTEYVSKFGGTAQAPDAQYYIASIHYSNQEWDDAVKSFDTLIGTYPDNKTRMPSALFYKADALNKLGRATEATDAMKELRKRFPNDPKAKGRLQ